MLDSITLAARWIHESEAILIAAGAGMSVDSGLPDFRGEKGLYNPDYKPFSKLPIPIMEAIKPSKFRTDPHLAWGGWGHRLNIYRNAVPHQGYKDLLEITKNKARYVQTSNIDGQFQKAGFRQEEIHEFHGSLHRLQCIHPCSDDVWSSEAVNLVVDPDTMLTNSPLPTCNRCGAVARPHVFMFGDTNYLWNSPKGHSENYREWLKENREKKLVVIECGAGVTVPSLRRHCEEITNNTPHAKMVRINLKDSDIPNQEDYVSIQESALSGLGKIMATMKQV